MINEVFQKGKMMMLQISTVHKNVVDCFNPLYSSVGKTWVTDSVETAAGRTASNSLHDTRTRLKISSQ